MTDESERPVAWTAIPRHEAVYDRNGEEVGVVDEVLGTGETGIFHGLVVRHHLLQRPVEVPADDVDTITNRRVTLKLDGEACAALPDHVEEKSYSLGIRGIFRHRPAWVEDSKGDL